MSLPTGELLADYVRKYPEARREIAYRCHVNVNTVGQWLKGKLPRGHKLAKLQLWLMQNVGQPKELEALTDDVRCLLALVANDAIDTMSVMRIIGSTSPTDQQLWKYLQNKTSMLPQSQQRLEEWLNSEKERGVSWRQHAASVMSHQAPVTQVDASHEVVDVTKITSYDPDLIAGHLAALLQSAFPLAKHLESDAFTTEDRARFRTRIGDETLFKLTNALTRLSGDQARSLTARK